MANVYFSRVLNASASQVWAFVRDFGAAARWFPSLKDSELRSGGPNTVGAVRAVTTTDGSVLEEQLVEISDAERRIVYDLIKGEVPFRNYRGILTIREIVADPTRCFAEWSGRFDVAGDPAPVVEFIRDTFYNACLEELERVCQAAR